VIFHNTPLFKLFSLAYKGDVYMSIVFIVMALLHIYSYCQFEPPIGFP